MAFWLFSELISLFCASIHLFDRRLCSLLARCLYLGQRRRFWPTRSAAYPPHEKFSVFSMMATKATRIRMRPIDGV
jgi:hypothetical protein